MVPWDLQISPVSKAIQKCPWNSKKSNIWTSVLTEIGGFHQPNLKNVLVRLDHFLGPMWFLDGSYLRTLNRVSGIHLGNTFHQEVEQRVVCWNMMGLENYD